MTGTQLHTETRLSPHTLAARPPWERRLISHAPNLLRRLFHIVFIPWLLIKVPL